MYEAAKSKFDIIFCMNNILISSIDTGGGKTFISAGVAAVMQSFGYKTGVYKPVQTGASEQGAYLSSPDLKFVKLLDPYIITHSTYMIKEKVSPAVICEERKLDINLEEINTDYNLLSKKTDTLIVESPGALMMPLNKSLFTYHIPQELKLPVAFIVNPSNDSVSHYLNEINTAKTIGIDILGVIINKFPVYSESKEIKSFPNLIEKYSDVKVLGLIRNFKGKTVNSSTLINEILNGIDLEDLFRMKISKLNFY